MSNLKNTVDILASLASLIAIVTVLVSWYRSARKPLKIERVVIHSKPTESKFILIVKNRKNYPVKIKTISCYTNKLYNIEKRPGQNPEYSELLNLADNLFRNKETFTIGANGKTDIQINGNHIDQKIGKLLFSINTSHGYHELWCNNLLIVEFGKGEVYDLDYRHEYNSKLKAKTIYLWLRIKSFIKRS